MEVKRGYDWRANIKNLHIGIRPPKVANKLSSSPKEREGRGYPYLGVCLLCSCGIFEFRCLPERSEGRRGRNDEREEELCQRDSQFGVTKVILMSISNKSSTIKGEVSWLLTSWNECNAFEGTYDVMRGSKDVTGVKPVGTEENR